ncbi:MAG: hypothetical protein HQM09_10265 [Candidatus Riflebacteria bacterium]|nr:hypothetical protein [Candidatus Riflebacteria bacterium]MBF0500507.1 hypothetical protein [Candidatus Riflebacteria bacterium]
MGVLSFIKGMKIEDNLPVEVTFRSSKSNGALGGIMVCAGTGLLWQVYEKNPLFCCLNVVTLASIGLAAAFGFIGILIITYRKCVIISRLHSRIDYMESSIFCWHRAVYAFDELIRIEISQVAECLFTSKSFMWTVKGYFQRGNDLSCARLFESLSSEQAKEAASMLSQILRRPVLTNSCRGSVRTSFTSQAGV